MRQYFQKHKYHFGTLIILLIIAGISWKFSFNVKNTDEITNLKSQTPKKYPISNIQYQNDIQTPNSDNQIPTSTLQVIPTQGTGSRLHVGTSYQLLITTTSTVYDAMKDSQLDFKTKTFSGLGEFVEEIGGLKNDPQKGKYWGYFINGESAKLGISTQIVKPNDLIEWTYGNTNL